MADVPSAKGSTQWGSEVHAVHAASGVDREHHGPVAADDCCLRAPRAHHVVQHHLGKRHPRVLIAGGVMLRLGRRGGALELRLELLPLDSLRARRLRRT